MVEGCIFFVLQSILLTVVVAQINTMKTTFDSNFDLYQAVKQHMDIEVKRSC